MTKQDEFNLRKEKGEQQLKAIRDAAASNNPDQALADQKEVITAIKGKTQEKLKSLKQRKQANYSLAKKRPINVGMMGIRKKNVTLPIVRELKSLYS